MFVNSYIATVSSSLLMEAFRSPAFLQLLELSDYLNGGKIAERQSDKPEATIDARGSNQRCWDGLNAESQAHGRCLDAA
jgi:hypothetical protein